MSWYEYEFIIPMWLAIMLFIALFMVIFYAGLLMLMDILLRHAGIKRRKRNQEEFEWDLKKIKAFKLLTNLDLRPSQITDYENYDEFSKDNGWLEVEEWEYNAIKEALKDETDM